MIQENVFDAAAIYDIDPVKEEKTDKTPIVDQKDSSKTKSWKYWRDHGAMDDDFFSSDVWRGEKSSTKRE